jgi:hypothetical protein
MYHAGGKRALYALSDTNSRAVWLSNVKRGRRKFWVQFGKPASKFGKWVTLESMPGKRAESGSGSQSAHTEMHGTAQPLGLGDSRSGSAPK